LSSHTTRSAPHDDRKGLGWLVLLPIACCGGPPLIAGIAVVGAAAAAGLGVGVAVIAIAVTLVVVRRRRAARCCTPANSAAEGPTGLDTSVLDEKRGPSR
jgi:Flp pilus assembly protein TadB